MANISPVSSLMENSDVKLKFDRTVAYTILNVITELKDRYITVYNTL